MKKVFIFWLFSFASTLFAQEKTTFEAGNEGTAPTKETGQGLRFDVIWRNYYILPLEFGNHALADAHRSGFGLGTSFGLLEYHGFRLTIGTEFQQYKVSDISKVGNFTKSNAYNYFFALSYDWKINPTFLLVPTVGLGENTVNQRKHSKRFGSYEGRHWRLGIISDVKLAKDLSVFLGIHYIDSSFDIKTHPEFESYFQNAKQIQFTIGLKID